MILAVRFLAFVAFVGAILLILNVVSSPTSSSGPYISALSNLAGSPAYAAKPSACNHKACSADGKTCVRGPKPSKYNCGNSGQGCVITWCA